MNIENTAGVKLTNWAAPDIAARRAMDVEPISAPHHSPGRRWRGRRGGRGGRRALARRPAPPRASADIGATLTQYADAAEALGQGRRAARMRKACTAWKSGLRSLAAKASIRRFHAILGVVPTGWGYDRAEVFLETPAAPPIAAR